MASTQLRDRMAFALKTAITEKQNNQSEIVAGMCYLAQEFMKVHSQGETELHGKYFSVYFDTDAADNLVVVGVYWYGASYGDITTFPPSFTCDQRQESLVPIKIEIPDMPKMIRSSESIMLRCAYVYSPSKGPSFYEPTLQKQGYDTITRFLLSEWASIHDPIQLEEQYQLNSKLNYTLLPITPCVLETDEQYIYQAVHEYTTGRNCQIDSNGLPILTCFGVDLSLKDPLQGVTLEKYDGGQFIGVGRPYDYDTCRIRIETKHIPCGMYMDHYLHLKKQGYLIVHDITYTGVPAARAAYRRLVELVEKQKPIVVRT